MHTFTKVWLRFYTAWNEISFALALGYHCSNSIEKNLELKTNQHNKLLNRKLIHLKWNNLTGLKRVK